jgi:sugar/nucleoside kinase (ribokinase family)
MEPFDVLCIGMSAVDIFCDSLERVPEEGEFWLIDNIAMFPGGCPTSTAIVTSKLHLRTRLITLIGNDIFGTFLINELKNYGIITDQITMLDGHCTGKSVILLVKGSDRRLMHQRGANDEFNIEHVNFDCIESSSVVFLSSYMSGLPKLGKQDVIGIFRHAKEKGKTTILDLLIDARERRPMNSLTGVLKYTDYLILNQDEGRLLTGNDDPMEQGKSLLREGALNVVIKRGPKGSFFMNSQAEFMVDAYRVEVKDPTGAGDSFNGGFIYALLQRWKIEKALRFANIVGASAVTKLGCTAGVYELPKLTEILTDLEKE